MDLPKKFLDRMKKLLGDEYEEFLNSYSKLPTKSFFVNKNKISEDDFLSCCDWKVEKCAEGWRLLENVKVGKTPEHHAGMIYMQELSAMMPTTFLPLKPTDMVLDLCASPGGKSIQVANRLTDGFLISNEIVKARANVLRANIERMGLKNVCVTNNEPNELEDYFGGIFDAVVVDAPCSGEGMFRKDEGAIINWSPENVEACANRQLAILESANKMLRKNGYLLYSTCTFSVEEDEGVVAKFCQKHNYKIIPLKYEGATSGVKIEGEDTEKTLRFYPHKFDGEGQFVALLQKMEDNNTYINRSNVLKRLNEFKTEYNIFKGFCEVNLQDYEDILQNSILKNNVIYYTENLSLAQSGVRLVNVGVILGEITKGRFEANHNMVTCFGQRFKKSIDLDFEQANKYLRGETLDCKLDGFVVVKYKGVALGLGKSSLGVLKNHYPKGLRNI